ncbi:hypothetical protein [Pseudonocardia ailaonensis]|uniref:hypothetical protein n=1 Tax=Pseudonocardia ailaonensis TaxID=367279 RepID=UPI0031DEE9D0
MRRTGRRADRGTADSHRAPRRRPPSPPCSTGAASTRPRGSPRSKALVIATRSGSVDPGLELWLAEREHLEAHEIAETLEHRCGLAALAGTPDLQEITARDDAGARLALDVCCHRIAAMAVSAGGLDALAFTGGVGENSEVVRARVADRVAFLGVDVDPGRNATTDGEITAEGATVRVLVVPAREDLEIARNAHRAQGELHPTPPRRQHKCHEGRAELRRLRRAPVHGYDSAEPTAPDVNGASTPDFAPAAAPRNGPALPVRPEREGPAPTPAATARGYDDRL